MTTNRSAISDVKSGLKLNHVDTELPIRAIYSKILQVRNKYVKQQTDKRKLWASDSIFTSLKIELEEVPLADYCNFQSDCTVSRSKIKLPKIMDSGLFGLIHAGISSFKGRNKFKEIDPNTYSVLKDLKLPGGDIYYWILDDYLIVDSPTLDTVVFRPFLEDDEWDFSLSTECDDAESGCPDNPLDRPFKCPGYLKEDIITSVVNYYTERYKRSLQDTTSDDMDTTK